MREQQQQSASSQHHADLIILAEMAGVKVPEDVMKILIELLDMNVQPAELHQTLRDIAVKISRARKDSLQEDLSKKSNARRSNRLTVARSIETLISPSVASGTSHQNIV